MTDIPHNHPDHPDNDANADVLVSVELVNLACGHTMLHVRWDNQELELGHWSSRAQAQYIGIILAWVLEQAATSMYGRVSDLTEFANTINEINEERWRGL